MPEAKHDRNVRVAEYYGRGFSMRETAKRFRITLERVRQILRRDFPDLIRPPHVGMSKPPAARLADPQP